MPQLNGFCASALQLLVENMIIFFIYPDFYSVDNFGKILKFWNFSENYIERYNYQSKMQIIRPGGVCNNESDNKKRVSNDSKCTD